MKTQRLLPALMMATLSWGVAHAADVFAPGFLKREYFEDKTRAEVLAGTAGAPTSVSAIPTFEAPINVGSTYAQRVSGFFIPATAGDYVFFIAADDDADLFLSTDADPAKKKLIAQEAGWSASRQWVTAPAGASTPENKRSDTFDASE